MKCLTFFVHASAENEIVDCLRGNEHLTGFTLTPCQGHSTATGDDPFQGAQDLVVGYVPRVRIDVVLEDDKLEVVLDRVRGCLRQGASLGAWQVTDILGFGRL